MEIAIGKRIHSDAKCVCGYGCEYVFMCVVPGWVQRFGPVACRSREISLARLRPSALFL